MRTADIGLFAWEPLAQRVTIAERLDTDGRRYVLALALAHRALGHWGNSPEQDIEAHELMLRWFIPELWTERDSVPVEVDEYLAALTAAMADAAEPEVAERPRRMWNPTAVCVAIIAGVCGIAAAYVVGDDFSLADTILGLRQSA